MVWKHLDELDLNGKRVLTRVDINVPMQDGIVTDTTRIDRIIPTIKAIQKAGGIPIIIAHFGRPEGKRVTDLSLAQLVPTLEEAFAQKVTFIDMPFSEIASLTPEKGDILLVENIRFHPGETKNDPEFAKSLASIGDIYCNDAFSAAHRAHASTTGVAEYLPSCAGKLMAAELSALSVALGTPKPPVTAVIGGAKVSTKLTLLENLMPKMDTIIIGGGMANTFLAALGYSVGKSLYEKDLIPTASSILEQAKNDNCKLLLPKDIVVAKEFAAGTEYEILDVSDCPKDGMILDCGPETVKEIISVFQNSNTLVWNGPLGAFEIKPFDTATNAAALEAAKLSKAGKLLSVAGGGDTVSALNISGAAKDFTYISTAGGAFLEWLEGKPLPGVHALN